MKKICSKCNKELDIKCFSFKNKRSGTRRADCKECFSKLTKTHYQNNKHKYAETLRNLRNRNREFIKSSLIDKSCADCGNTDWRVLEFDHVRGVKIAGISDLSYKRFFSLEKIQEEMDKCEIRCANCHRLVSYSRMDNCYKS